MGRLISLTSVSSDEDGGFDPGTTSAASARAPESQVLGHSAVQHGMGSYRVHIHGNGTSRPPPGAPVWTWAVPPSTQDPRSRHKYLAVCGGMAAFTGCVRRGG